MKRAFLFGLMVIALAGCRERGQRLEDLPTPAEINALATAQIQTENAPPPGFRESVSFPQIDANLNLLPGWRYIVTLEFNGTFDGTPRETSATARAEIWFNQVASARRVVVETAGELLGQEEDTAYEAVKLGPDAFLVRDSVCLGNAGQDAQAAAELSAGQLVGGVERAVPGAKRATLNGEDAWLYTFSADELNLPNIHVQDGGTLALTGGELWVAPEHNAVMRFYLNLDVTKARIFDRQLAVSGSVVIRYDLYDVGTAANITVPFGC